MCLGSISPSYWRAGTFLRHGLENRQSLCITPVKIQISFFFLTTYGLWFMEASAFAVTVMNYHFQLYFQWLLVKASDSPLYVSRMDFFSEEMPWFLPAHRVVSDSRPSLPRPLWGIKLSISINRSIGPSFNQLINRLVCLTSGQPVIWSKQKPLLCQIIIMKTTLFKSHSIKITHWPQF